MSDVTDYEVSGVSEKSSDQKIIKYIFDLSKELNIEDTRGVVGNELELIALVRNCRFLYDKNLSDFKDIRKKNVAWTAIASVMHSKVHDVQQRWRSLREGYNKYKKELESLGDINGVRPWEYYEEMKFIEPYIVHRRSAFSRGSGVAFSDELENSNDESRTNYERNADTMQLITSIQAHPVLYDNKHPHYKVRENKIQAWNEVAQAVGISVNECEIRWKNLRERYGRERKSKDTQIDKKQWEYFEALSFLDTHIKSRRHSIFRPILPKPTVEENASNVTILSSLPASQPTFILKHLIKDISKQSIVQNIEVTEEKPDIKLNPSVDVQHVEFVDASNPVPSRSPSVSPTLSDTKLNLGSSYLSPSSEQSHFIHDEDELFGQTITAELRRMPSGKKKMKIKAEIYKILYDNESDN